MTHAQRTMLSAVFVLGCFCVWPTPLVAQDTQSAETRSAASRSAPHTSRIAQDLRTLTSEDLLGRGPDTDGLERTRDWLERRFKALGLKPAIGTNYLRAIPDVTVSARVRSDTEVRLGDRVLARGVEYDVSSSSPSGTLTGTARVVDASWSPDVGTVQ